MYPVPVINYQSADHIKALHYFVLRKPLGERGLMWLYAHIAGCADLRGRWQTLSKMPLQDRVDWATENEDMLLDIARNWRDRYDLWSTADKPFSFVVGCMELLAAIEHYDAYGNWDYLVAAGLYRRLLFWLPALFGGDASREGSQAGQPDTV